MNLPDYGGTLWSKGRVSIDFAFEPCVIALIPFEVWWCANAIRFRVAVVNVWIALTIKRTK